MDTIFDYVIVGAGMTGLYLGWEFKNQSSAFSVVILEKSKSCGGRMATRRVGDLKFDHGAQFIKKMEVSQKLINFLEKERSIRPFFEYQPQTYCGLHGMTEPAKKLAENLNVRYDTKVSRILLQDNVWRILGEGEVLVQAHNVLLTSPLPQSLEILRNSSLHFDPRLSDLYYAKAIVFMLESDEELDILKPHWENVSDEIFSITNQKFKGVSSRHSYTVVMSELWSENYFDENDENLKILCSRILNPMFLARHVEILQVKKWRYCQPRATWSEPFYVSGRGCYLAGDAFGGPSLNGALRSASGLLNYLMNTVENKI